MLRYLKCYDSKVVLKDIFAISIGLQYISVLEVTDTYDIDKYLVFTFDYAASVNKDPPPCSSVKSDVEQEMSEKSGMWTGQLPRLRAALYGK